MQAGIQKIEVKREIGECLLFQNKVSRFIPRDAQRPQKIFYQMGCEDGKWVSVSNCHVPHI